MKTAKGLKRYKSKGHWYTYDRATGIRLEPPHEYGSTEFWAALARITASTSQPETKAPKTLGSLVALYRASPAFQRLRTRTREDYERNLDWLKPLNDVWLKNLTAPMVARIHERAFTQHKRKFANYVLQMISILCGYAIALGAMENNPARHIKRIQPPTDHRKPNRAWAEAEYRVVFETASPQLRLPIALARWIGMREGDVLKLPRNAYQDGVLRFVSGKYSVEWESELIPPELKALLEAPRRHSATTLCASSRGQPWTEDGFRTSFFRHIARLERKGSINEGLTFHGLRTTVAERLADLGFTSADIAAYLAQRSPRSAEHYIKYRARNQTIRRIAEALSEQVPNVELSNDVSNRRFV